MLDNSINIGSYHYELTAPELARYRKLYLEHYNKIDIHRIELWFAQYFSDLHQTVFNQAVAILTDSSKTYTEEETVKLLQDLEWKNVEPDMKWLGIENNIRLRTFAKNVMRYAERNKSTK